MPSIDYSIPAIPTVRGGQHFRSRLEARWAAFFDLCGWEWVYEPADFPGWFPDFGIKKVITHLADYPAHFYITDTGVCVND